MAGGGVELHKSTIESPWILCVLAKLDYVTLSKSHKESVLEWLQVLVAGQFATRESRISV